MRTTLLTIFTASLLASSAGAFELDAHLDDSRWPPQESDACSFENFMEDPGTTLKKATAGDACSQYHLAQQSKNQDNAEVWLRSAAKQNVAPAQYMLGKILIKNGKDTEGRSFLFAAASNRHGAAANELGNLYRGKDDAESCRWFEVSAKSNNPSGQNNHGVCLLTSSLPDRLGLAAIHFDRSARQSNVTAEFNLAKAFELEGSTAQAFQQYRRAIDAGNTKAMIMLANNYWAGPEAILNLKQDQKEALKLYLRAAKAGDPEADFKVAQIYRLGADGIAKQEEAAVKFLKSSSSLGYSRGSKALSEMYGTGWMIYRKKEVVDKATGKKELVIVAERVKPDQRKALKTAALAEKQEITEAKNGSGNSNSTVYFCD